MNIPDFISKVGVKEKTVDKWLNAELIPGAFRDKNGEWFIPNSAKAPYVKARAKAKESIFISIVSASHQGFHVIPKLYGKTDTEFLGYINQLVAAGLITLRTEDGITYYDETIASKNFLDVNSKTRSIRIFILDSIERVSKGITEALLEEAGK